MKILIMNGPPGCGKDAAVNTLVKKREAYPFSFKRKLINVTRAIYDLTEDQWTALYTRENKEIPSDIFYGLSPRQALIKVSEEVIKPNYGKDFFGKAEAENIEKHLKLMPHLLESAACSDGGFAEEIVPLVDVFGPENVFIIKIFRPECSYEGDSRNWIDCDKVPDKNYITIHNESDLKTFQKEVLSLYDYITETLK